MRVAAAQFTRRYRLADDPGVLVTGAALACCGLELASAGARGLLIPEAPGDAVRASVLVLAGTVTETLAPAVIAAWEALDGPRAAVAFGACASSGGPYWDAPTVVKGGDSLVPVAAYVPGCPPRPEALVDGIRLAAAAAA